MQYIDNLCVTTIVYYNFAYESLYVTWEIHFLLNIYFACLIRDGGKCEPSVKLISEKHASSMTTIFSQNISTLSLDEWYDLLFIYGT